MCFCASSEILFVRVVFACLPLLVLKIFFFNIISYYAVYVIAAGKKTIGDPCLFTKLAPTRSLFTLYTNLTPMINNSPKPR